MLKFAVGDLSILDSVLIPQDANRAARRKIAHRHHFDYTPRSGYLYVRSRAISSRCNDNFDEFPAEEIAKAYKTFVGKPVFVNHHNDDHRQMRGVIIDAALHRDTLPTGAPDTWCEVLMEVDAVRFPKLASEIIAGNIDRTSMGCDVAYSECSACGNRATSPAEYCNHIPRMKGQRIYRADPKTGKKEGVLIREICYGLKFFENSLLVEEPADPTAYFLGVDTSGLGKAASKTASGPFADLEWADDRERLPNRTQGAEEAWQSGGTHPDLCPGCGHQFKGQYGKVCPVCEDQVVGFDEDTYDKHHTQWLHSLPINDTRRTKPWEETPNHAWAEHNSYPSSSGQQSRHRMPWWEPYDAVTNRGPEKKPSMETLRPSLSSMASQFVAAGVPFDEHRRRQQSQEALNSLFTDVMHDARFLGHEPRHTPVNNLLSIHCEHCPEGASITKNNDTDQWEVTGTVHRKPCEFNPASIAYTDQQAPPGEPVSTHGYSPDMWLKPSLNALAANFEQGLTPQEPEPFKIHLTSDDMDELRAYRDAGEMRRQMHEHGQKREVNLSDPVDLKAHLAEAHEFYPDDFWRNSHEQDHEALDEGSNDDRPLRPHELRALHDYDHHHYPGDYPGVIVGDSHFHSASRKASLDQRVLNPEPIEMIHHKPTDTLRYHCPDCGGYEYQTLPHEQDGRAAMDALIRNHQCSTGLSHVAKAPTRVRDMTPEEHEAYLANQEKKKAEFVAFNKKHPVRVKNIVDHWDKATDAEIHDGKNWYSDAHHLVKHIANDTHTDMTTMAGLMANYSPQTHWASNIHTVARVARLKQPMGGKGEGVMASETQKENARRMLAGEHYNDVLGSAKSPAPKTKAFAHLIEHVTHDDHDGDGRVCVDRHALSVACGARVTDHVFSATNLSSPAKYNHVADAYVKAAKHISKKTGKTVHPHQVQAVTWMVRQRLNQAEDNANSASGTGSRSAKAAMRHLKHWEDYAGEHHPGAVGMIPGTGYAAHHAPEEVKNTKDLADEGKISMHASNPMSDSSSAADSGSHSARETSSCKVCGSDIYKVKDGSPDKYAWQHDITAGAGIPHQAYPIDTPDSAQEAAMGIDVEAMWKAAYGDTKAPVDVDTLRESECPVCGNDDSWDGDRCMVCGFFRPPQMFMDPDTSVAREMDLRQDVADQTGGPDPTMGADGETVGAAPSQTGGGGGMTLDPLDQSQVSEDGMVAGDDPNNPPSDVMLNTDQADPNGLAAADMQEAANEALMPQEISPDGVDMGAADKHFNQGGEPFTPGPNAPTPEEPMDPAQVSEDGSDPLAAEQVPDEDGQEPGPVSNGEPGTPGDGVPDLICPACGFQAEGASPMSMGDSAMDPTAQPNGALEGDACPQCGKAPLTPIAQVMVG